MDWITDWKLIDDETIYIVSQINARSDGTPYLGIGHIAVFRGWCVKRLTEQCYAALPMPEFKGLSPKGKP